ncbi:hypothetical protein HY003_03500 [Candidatus Saccharibacteria bacterium]|nr:hypothetical protein [Candidatus Saccharibacteria bacterium]MBI3338339.1 hypothetical protein [Candidatus Saccharibacteria bacterium]
MNPLATEWLQKTLAEKRQAIEQLLAGNPSLDYINLVTTNSIGVVASLGKNFSYAIFARDSIRVAKDLIETHRELAHDIILILAHLQGTKFDNISEEEPGKIHHEHRSLIFDGQRISKTSEEILRSLQLKWGGKGTDTMTYYGSFDATPLFVRLVHSYTTHYGNDILQESFKNKDGNTRTVTDSLRAAIDWVSNKLESSEWGLLEYRRLNPMGIANQVWKDSQTAYLHADGSMANYDNGIAAIELQGYAYDTLMDALKLFKGDRDTYRWQEQARVILRYTIQHFWMEDYNYFAQGLDRDSAGNMRQIKSLTSNPGLLLRSGLLRDIEPDIKQKAVKGIVNMITGPDFLTDGGIRCRALSHKKYPGFPDYHGSFTTWPKETYEIAKGLHAHGFIEEARNLDNRVLESVKKSGDFYEFYYVNDDASIWYNSHEAIDLIIKAFGSPANMPVPEVGQAWTISAVLAILHHRS